MSQVDISEFVLRDWKIAIVSGRKEFELRTPRKIHPREPLIALVMREMNVALSEEDQIISGSVQL
jgi:hypothetical protein